MARSSPIVSDALRACRKERATGFKETYECLVEKVLDERARRDIPGDLPQRLYAEIDRATKRSVASAARAHKHYVAKVRRR